jgi:hypothetical protein
MKLNIKLQKDSVEISGHYGLRILNFSISKKLPTAVGSYGVWDQYSKRA